MIFGLSLSGFTTLHVILSLIGIVAGVVVAFGMLGARRLPGWTALFLATTVLTSVTGFMFPFTQLLPSHVFGIISLIALAIAVLAYYVFRLEGRWRWLYILSAMPGALPQRLRRRGAGLSEACLPCAAGADAIRAAIRRCPAGAARLVRRLGWAGVKVLPSHATGRHPIAGPRRESSFGIGP